ncbi:MAG: Gfo/Idh/MocA family oxidoreductase, partial [Candidatus Hydrogenedentota bacterium]
MTRIHNKGMSRRQFLRTMGAAGAALTVLPGHLRAGAAANSKLQVASIGTDRNLPALMGSGNMELVALCDVDHNLLENIGAEYPDARRFTDWRELFDVMGDEIDAVHVPTPDHSHAGPAMRAINMGKHAFVEKPLTRQVHEARQLRLAAQREGVVTQMGIQIHSSANYRNAVEIIQSGAIGRVKEVHSWSDKTWGRAEDGLPDNTEDPPDTLNWDAWIGPTEWREYAPGHYHLNEWRRWLQFGCGTMGDMGIHILDPVVGSLELGPPTTILSQSPPP